MINPIPQWRIHRDIGSPQYRREIVYFKGAIPSPSGEERSWRRKIQEESVVVRVIHREIRIKTICLWGENVSEVKRLFQGNEFINSTSVCLN